MNKIDDFRREEHDRPVKIFRIATGERLLHQ